MHPPRLRPIDAEATGARCGGASALAQALQATRRDTLATFDAVAAALPDLAVPYRADLNPPLWELGHIGWFQDYWLARNPAWRNGAAADHDAPRRPGLRANADALYDSSHVPHGSRWTLPLPSVDDTRAELAAQLQRTLQLLQGIEEAPPDDTTPYFFRLALHHEDMHHEAALYMAQALGIAIVDARWQPQSLPGSRPQVTLPAGPWRLGSEPDSGFAFDNELAAHSVELGATHIDAQAVRWADYLPFAEAGGYGAPRWWDAAGRDWLGQHPVQAPRYLRRDGNAWLQWRHGIWQALDPNHAACHLTFHEAQAWCRWAGRRLPSEAEWERAAFERPGDFRWGDVWEWTASRFAPYPGFTAHPYRDYSAPWFDGRPVLRGASFMTHPRMRHARYRNYFAPQRSDVAAGFRSCAL